MDSQIFRERYLDWMQVRKPDFKSLRFGIDCSNGMASLLASALFPNAEIINATPDGTFPSHSPNPLKAEAREQIAALVREKGLDCGVIFDGDADRAMFVDETGAFVQPDYLIPIVAEATRAALKPAAARPIVLHDVRTSRGATEVLRERGFEPVMVPVGHAFAKPKMRELNALCGGELAGHYYFGEFFGCDSGVLAAMRILGAAAQAKARGETFSQMMKPIVSRYANSGELNFKVADKDAAIRRVLAAAQTFGPETGRSEIDGVRVEFADGWISVRKSNTEPYLRLLVETTTDAKLTEWTAVLSKSLLEADAGADGKCKTAV
jgi:phosphomannomutase